MWTMARFLVTLAVIATSTAALSGGEVEETKRLKAGGEFRKLDVLPGRGWDCLRNEDMGQIVSDDYSERKLTVDNKYLIPDNIEVVPVKESSLQMQSEVIRHWMNYSTLTDTGVHISAGFSYDFIGIKGSFSKNYLLNKKSQIEHGSITARSHARYSIYKVSVVPSPQLHPKFKNRLLNALNHLEANTSAKYSLELIVKDYGTHVLNQVTAGGMIVMESLISNEYENGSAQQRALMEVTAVATFFRLVNLDIGDKKLEEQSGVESFEGDVISRGVRAIGGVLLRTNMSLDYWAGTISEQMAPIDRSGIPLADFIEPEMFPNVSYDLVQKLSQELKSVVDAYYSYNTHAGCTNPNSPNFEPTANVDDHSCTKPFRNYTFGGVFQTCVAGPDAAICNTLSQSNPLTGDFSCPDGFRTVPLRNVRVETQINETVCDHKDWLRRCQWSQVARLASASYEAYWCVAQSPIQLDTGAMFGGVYTSDVNNPLTESKSCPPTFASVKIFADLHVCVGVDYEDGFRYSAEFGGFFSCSAGNPLASTNHTSVFETDAFRHFCSGGYSQHVAYITHDNCPIYYCMRTKTLPQQHHIEIRLPPFSSVNQQILSVTHDKDTTNLNVAQNSSNLNETISILVILCLSALYSGILKITNA